MDYCTPSTTNPLKGKINFLRDRDYEKPYCQLIEDIYENI
jgi:hypothetical protein